MRTSTAASIFRTIAKSRVSTKRFHPNKKIPQSVLQDILETTLTSPSGFNLQPTHVILVQSPEIKSELSQNSMLGIGNLYRVNDAPVIAVFLSDLEPKKRIPKIVEMEYQSSGARTSGYLATLPVTSSFLLGEGITSTFMKKIATDAMSTIKPMPSVENVESWSYKNAGLMAQTYVFAATSFGLGTSIMEGFDPRRAKEILNIPDRYGIPFMVATGYEYEGNDEKEIKKSPRLDFSDVFFDDSFGRPMKYENNEHNSGKVGREGEEDSTPSFNANSK